MVNSQDVARQLLPLWYPPWCPEVHTLSPLQSNVLFPFTAPLLGWGASPITQGVKNLCAMQETQKMWVQSLGQEDPWVRKIPWRRAWQPTPVFLPGESHGWGKLVGYSPRGHKELDMTGWLSTQHKVVYVYPSLSGYLSLPSLSSPYVCFLYLWLFLFCK